MKNSINSFKKVLGLSVLCFVFLLGSCEKEVEIVDIKITTPTIKTSEVTEITKVSAICGGYNLSDEGAGITKKGVCWSTTANPELNDELTNNGTGEEDFESLLINLLPNTTYYVRAYALNRKGTNYGEQKSFTTIIGTPEISTSEIASIAPTTAMCGGYDLSNEGATITAKGVCWSTTVNSTLDDDYTDEGSGDEDFESQLIDLIPGTTYYVRAYATNSAGTSFAEELCFKTPYVENIYNGNVVLTTQQEVDDFGSNNYTAITDGLRIGPSNNITDLSSLISINSLDRYLWIKGNDALTDLAGLDNITTSVVSTLIIYDNEALISISALDNFTTRVNGNLMIYLNDVLTSLSGLESITYVGGDLDISINPELIEISALSNVKSVGESILISRSFSLTSLDGLNNITSVGWLLHIKVNPLLTDLSGLNNLTSVPGSIYVFDNDGITSLSGLDNLASVGRLSIIDNGSLTDLCSIRPLLINNGLDGSYFAIDNGYNPTQQDIIDGNCSQ